MNATTRTQLKTLIARMEATLQSLRNLVAEAEEEEAQMLDDMAEADENAPLDDEGELTDEQFAALLFKPRDYACVERMGW